jgi:hypothetical protein
MVAARTLTSVPIARYETLPWSLRMVAAREEMRRRSAISLDIRTSLLQYVAHERRADRSDTAVRGDAPAGPIWSYWAQGLSEAPRIVRACLRSITAMSGGREVIVLEDRDLRRFASLPDHIVRKKAAIGTTHFSDILRTALLAEHGGTWIDATVLLTGRIPSDVTDQPFFAFTRRSDPYLLSTWFLHAQAGHPLVTSLRDMLYRYWLERDTLADYFLFHFLFECGVTLDAHLRRCWLDVPVVDFEPPHRLQAMLNARFDPAAFDAMHEATWIHKLTWKLERSPVPAGPTFFDVVTALDR